MKKRILLVFSAVVMTLLAAAAFLFVAPTPAPAAFSCCQAHGCGTHCLDCVPGYYLLGCQCVPAEQCGEGGCCPDP